jgi:hypothetical protein
MIIAAPEVVVVASVVPVSLLCVAVTVSLIAASEEVEVEEVEVEVEEVVVEEVEVVEEVSVLDVGMPASLLDPVLSPHAFTVIEHSSASARSTRLLFFRVIMIPIVSALSRKIRA